MILSACTPGSLYLRLAHSAIGEDKELTSRNACKEVHPLCNRGPALLQAVPDPASPEDVGEEHQRDKSYGAVAEGSHDCEQLIPILAEDIPDQRVGHGPHDRSYQVIGEKPVVFHSGNPGEEWGHAAQTRSEAPDEDGLSAVRLEVAFHPVEALLVDQEMEETHLEDTVDQWPPADAPDPIHGVVGDEGPNEAA